jgi:tripartite-type tricarboxylate transporter receptor subunit TctC
MLLGPRFGADRNCSLPPRAGATWSFGCRSLAVAAIFAVLTPAAQAQTYPSRPVTLVVPYGAGTQTDVNARLIAKYLEAELGQSFVVENRAGGNGLIGSANVAAAEANGYTLLVTTNTTHSAAPALFKKVPYDPQMDFTPVARMERFSSLLIVNPDLPVKTIQDFVAYAKSNPGTLEYGYGNASGQIAGEMLKRQTGIDMTRVAYRNLAQGVTDLIAGHIRVLVSGLNTLPFIRAGKMRALAVFSRQRSPVLPDVPTLDETVIPGFEMSAWLGVLGPANLPAEVVATLSGALHRVIERPEFRTRLQDDGIDAFWAGPKEFQDFIKTETVRWSALARDAGIEPE